MSGAYLSRKRRLEQANSTFMVNQLQGQQSNKELIDGFIVDSSQASIAKWIFIHYPETTLHVQSENLELRTKDMSVLLDIFKTLCYKKSCDISDAELRYVSANLSYLKQAGFKVEWLRAKLDDVYVNACKARIVELKEEVTEHKQMVSHLKAKLKVEEAKLKKPSYLLI